MSFQNPVFIPGPTNMPEVAKQRTKEGAAAFGRYYYDQIGEASVSGETDVLVALDLQSCPICADVV